MEIIGLKLGERSNAYVVSENKQCFITPVRVLKLSNTQVETP